MSRVLMYGVEQTAVARGNGDCLRACLATITGLDVPNLIESPRWLGLYRDWLRERGWAFTDDDGTRPVVGFSVAVGPSATFEDESHACVALDGIVVWDPNPKRDDPDRPPLEPLQFWPVFRLASGRSVYDPFAAECATCGELKSVYRVTVDDRVECRSCQETA